VPGSAGKGDNRWTRQGELVVAQKDIGAADDTQLGKP
jgi:hypothetical protein